MGGADCGSVTAAPTPGRVVIEGWHRDGVVARIVCCVVLAAIWAMILYPTWLGWNTYRALSDGVVTIATVTQIGEGGRYYDAAYLRFVTDDGRVVTASNSEIADVALQGDERHPGGGLFSLQIRARHVTMIER